jgi:hypothetical protein
LKALRFSSSVPLGTRASFDRFPGNHLGHLGDDAKGHDVRHQHFAHFLASDLDDGNSIDLEFSLGDLGTGIGIHQQNTIVLEVAVVLVHRLLGQSQQQVDVHRLGIVDILVRDDDLGAAGAPTRFRAVGLALGGVLVVVDGRRLGKHLAGEHEPLTAFTAQPDLVAETHADPPSVAMSFLYSVVYSGFSMSVRTPVMILSSRSSAVIVLAFFTDTEFS